MHVVVGLALGLVLGGLLMVYLCGGIQQETLRTVVYWTGAVLVVVGLVLLLTPAVVWLNLQLRSILGV